MVLLVFVLQILALFLQLLSGDRQSIPAFVQGWQNEDLVYPEAQSPAKHQLVSGTSQSMLILDLYFF